MGSRIPGREIRLPMKPPFFLDANVIMYALGAPHPLKAPRRNILERIKSEALPAVTNAEVLQEILHRYFSIGKPEIAEAAYASMVRLCMEIYPALAETDRALELMKSYPSITSRDAIHAATMLNHGLREIISADPQFDLVPGIMRIDRGKWGRNRISRRRHEKASQGQDGNARE